MIILYKPPGAWGLSAISPFAVKLETWLRLAKIPFETKPASMTEAPKGKVPYVRLDDGTLMGDSQLIQEELTKIYGVTLDVGLTAEQKALGHALRRMVEEATYWGLVSERWHEDAGFLAYTPVFKQMLPPVIGGLILSQIRRSVRNSLHAQGTGRHDKATIARMIQADLETVAVLLGDKPFFHGDAVRSVDATLYATISGFARFPMAGAGTEMMTKYPTLAAYEERVRALIGG